MTLVTGLFILKSNYFLVFIFVLLSRNYFSIDIIYILIFLKKKKTWKASSSMNFLIIEVRNHQDSGKL